MPHSLGSIKNRTDLFSGFWERPVLKTQQAKDKAAREAAAEELICFQDFGSGRF